MKDLSISQGNKDKDSNARSNVVSGLNALDADRRGNRIEYGALYACASLFGVLTNRLRVLS